MPAPAPANSLLNETTLVGQLGREVAVTLSSALDRVHQLTATGRIDRVSLRTLCDEIERARRAAITGQQLDRLAQGQVQLNVERLHLTTLLREALRQRGREIETRGVAVRQILAPAEVMSDATLLFSFLQTLLDWCFEHTASRLDLDLEVQGWPARARLRVGFFYRPMDESQELEADVDERGRLAEAAHPRASRPRGSMPRTGDRTSAPRNPVPQTHDVLLNSMDWHLLLQMASVLDLQLTRQDFHGRTELQLEFAQTAAPRFPDPRDHTNDEVPWDELQSQALARRQVLAVAAKRDLRNAIKEVLRPTGARLDMVENTAQARTWCQEVLPHAVIYEEAAAGQALEALRQELQNEAPGIAFLCITDSGRAFELLNVGGRQVASVGRDGLAESLAAALLFELSRQS